MPREGDEGRGPAKTPFPKSPQYCFLRGNSRAATRAEAPASSRKMRRMSKVRGRPRGAPAYPLGLLTRTEERELGSRAQILQILREPGVPMPQVPSPKPLTPAGVLELSARSQHLATCPRGTLTKSPLLAPPQTPEPISGSRMLFLPLPSFTPSTGDFSKVP